jgi:two-component system, OmpR family, sensor histidine kinase SenX3
VLTLRAQRRLARRLAEAARRLDAQIAASSPPDRAPAVGDAVALVERAVERTGARTDDASVAEQRLERALGAIAHGVVIYDEDGTVAHCNAAGRHFLAARHGEALVAEAAAHLREDAAAGLSGSRSVELFGPPRRTLEIRALPLEHEGEAAGALVVIEDVSERRRLEAVRRDFVANISHELKTPVGALGLLAETLLVEDDPALTRRMAERMLSEAFRVGRTIDDLLELSRIEAEEEATRSPVEVQECLEEAVDRVRAAAERRDVELVVDDREHRTSVLGDRRQLVSAVANLLENAVKYSDESSSVELRVREAGGWVEIAVVDHGIGIPRRDLERVFERFYRVDRGRSRETGGTGLGLAIVRHVAGNHRGEVRVASTEGQGSTFTIRLPAGSDGTPAPHEAPLAPAPAPGEQG